MERPVYHLEGIVKAKTDDGEDFVGPLDLILHLLSKNKLEIKDIQISLILEQYMAWIDRRKQLDLDVASDFVSMASHLIFIKTKMLLAVGDEEVLSEMEELIASLEARKRHDNYLKIKESIPAMERRYAVGQGYIAKQPQPISVERTYRYTHDKEDLRRAMSLVLARVDNKLPPPIAAFEGIVGREPYPVADKASEIIQRLLHSGIARFRALFHGNKSRSEIVATFIAVLELCSAKRLSLAGSQVDCTVTCVDESGDTEGDSATDEREGNDTWN